MEGGGPVRIRVVQIKSNLEIKKSRITFRDVIERRRGRKKKKKNRQLMKKRIQKVLIIFFLAFCRFIPLSKIKKINYPKKY